MRAHSPAHAGYGYCPGCGNTPENNPEKIMGVEDPRIYDGVLFWICEDCDVAFARWHLITRRRQQSVTQSENYNGAPSE